MPIKMQWRLTAAALLTAWSWSSALAQEPADGAAIDRAAVAEVAAKYKIPSAPVSHIELTPVFGTRSPWTLVITKQPDKADPLPEDVANGEGAVTVCFVRGEKPDCSDTAFLQAYSRQQYRVFPEERPFYTLFDSRIVHAGPDGRTPLLWIHTCSEHYGNGSCVITSLLYTYDAASDRFHTVFHGITGSNQNESTRFMDSGPLSGRVIVVTPTANAPYGYFVEVYRLSPNGDYGRILKYRSRTRYADGNSLPVIDSEMPEILRRFGLWKPGQKLPVLAARPKSCTELVMRRGAMWCASDAAVSPAARR